MARVKRNAGNDPDNKTISPKNKNDKNAEEPPKALAPSLRKAASPVLGMDVKGYKASDGMTIRDDFKAFGWSDKKIQDVMGMPEPKVDKFMMPYQSLQGHTDDDRRRHRENLERHLEKTSLRPNRHLNTSTTTTTTTANGSTVNTANANTSTSNGNVNISTNGINANGSTSSNGSTNRTDSTSPDATTTTEPSTNGASTSTSPNGKGKKAAKGKGKASTTNSSTTTVNPKAKAPKLTQQIFLEGSDSMSLIPRFNASDHANHQSPELVLYDANQELPADGVPAFITKWLRFAPRNKKVVAFNLVSGAVLLRTAPAEFEGREVKYQKAGPKLAHITSPKGGKKRGVEEMEAGGEDGDLEEGGAGQAVDGTPVGTSKRRRTGNGEGEASTTPFPGDGKPRRVMPARANRGVAKAKA